MRILALFLFLILGTTAKSASFKCEIMQSLNENLICHTPMISLLDDDLGVAYQQARQAVETWPEVYRGGVTPSEWFIAHGRKSLKWREDNCYDVMCLVRWYRERLALMEWITTAEDRLGDNGLQYISMLPDGDIIISYGMATHIRNVKYDVYTKKFLILENGPMTVSDDPVAPIVIYGHVSLFRNGERFTVDVKMGVDGLFYAMGAIRDGTRCMSRSEFIELTYFVKEDLVFVPGNNFCVYE